MNNIIDFLNTHKEILTLCVSIVVGVSTIITSVVSCNVMRGQYRIYEEQTKIQKLVTQPVFEIYISQQQDSDDGKYGTETIEIRNISNKMSSCKVSTNVFFALSYQHLTDRDTIYAEVKDYFLIAVHNSNDTGVVEKRWCPGNNRIFCEGYNASIKDCHDNTYYLYDRIILTKIEYQDILKEPHTIYFRSGYEISEEEYLHYFNESKKTFGERFFSLNDIKYDYLKSVLEKRSDNIKVNNP